MKRHPLSATVLSAMMKTLSLAALGTVIAVFGACDAISGEQFAQALADALADGALTDGALTDGGQDGTTDGTGGISCDVRQVVTAPAAARVTATTTIEADWTPSSGGLTTVLSFLELVVAQLNAGEPTTTSYDVGPDGSIIGGGRFVVSDGCLGIDLVDDGTIDDAPSRQATNSIATDLLTLQSDSPGRCGDGVPLGEDGIGVPTGNYTCIDSTITTCLACTQDATGWTQSATITATYVAEGGVQDTPAVELATGDINLVDVVAGEEIVVRITATTRYEVR